MRKMLVSLVFVLCLASPAWAFPDNGVLDTFTGCTDTTTPPNANWTNAVIFGATAATVDCEDGAATTTTTGTEGDAYWNATTFGAACEAYATIANTASTTDATVHCRLVNIGASTTDGYAVYWLDATNKVGILRLDNGNPTALVTEISQTITVGDSWGIRTIGGQICAWYKVGAGAWTQLSPCATDSTYSAGGRIGISITGNGGVGALDDFGGGNVTATRRAIPPIFFQ